MTIEEEFEYVPDAMFTNFRCFTDGCAALLDVFGVTWGGDREEDSTVTLYYAICIQSWKP